MKKLFVYTGADWEKDTAKDSGGMRWGLLNEELAGLGSCRTNKKRAYSKQGIHREGEG